jgi:hypothetical protein
MTQDSPHVILGSQLPGYRDRSLPATVNTGAQARFREGTEAELLTSFLLF